MLGLCKLATEDSDKPRDVAAILPSSRWVIERTWEAPGLKGTGSHHISLDTAVVEGEDFFDLSGQGRWASGPLYDGVQQMIALLHGAVSIGIAEGALDDLLAVAGSGRQQERAAVPMRDSEIFQCDLGRVHAEIRAARSLLRAQADSHWNHALAGRLGTDALLVEGGQAAIWIVGTCLRAVDQLFLLGGSAVLPDHSLLQRRMRDIHVAAQHSLMQPRHYAKGGRLLFSRAA
ncbi:MAG: acyl-CoA dehydrogenase family protein [Janthinobacterium lividum]